MRNLTSNALTKIAKSTGNEPILIVAVSWVDGTTTKYADKDLPGIPGKILQIGNIDEISKIRSGSSASVNIVLNDSDQSVMTLMHTHDVHLRPCTIYQYYDGMDIADAFILLEGVVSSPIVWDESTYTISFTVLTRIETFQVGFAPEEGQFQFVPSDLTGVPWPLCFGSPLFVPATKAQRVIAGTALTFFGIPDPSLPLKKDLLNFKLQNIQDAYNYYINLLDKVDALVDDPLTIQGRFTDYIIQQDSVAQQREDLADVITFFQSQLSQLKYQWGNERDATKRNSILGRYKDLRKNYLDYCKIGKGLTKQMEYLEDKKKEARLETKQSRFSYSLFGRVRNKIEQLFKEYLKAQEDVNAITEVMQTQASLMTTTAVVQYGEQFPQNQALILNINGLVIGGSFNGNILTFGRPLPTYSGIQIVPDPNLYDTFDVVTNNLTLNLNNHYCKMNNGAIIKIVSMSGIRCKFELIKRKDVTSYQRFQIDEDFLNQIRQQLGRYLTGNETDEELLAIANGFPSDIAPEVWDKLAGTNVVSILIGQFSQGPNKFTPTATGGTFRLKWGDEITDVINWNATGDDIVKALTALQSIPDKDFLSVDKPNVMANGNKLKLTFLIPLKKLEAIDIKLKSNDITFKTSVFIEIVTNESGVNKLNVEYTNTPTPFLNVFFYLVYNGERTPNLLYVSDFRKSPESKPNLGALDHSTVTADTIYRELNLLPSIQALLQANGAVLVTGGPLPDKPIMIKITGDSTCVFVEQDYTFLDPTSDPNTDPQSEAVTLSGSVICSFDQGHAQQYTRKKRTQLITSIIQRSTMKKSFDIYKKRLNAISQMLKDPNLTQAKRIELQNVVVNDEKSYAKMAKSMNLTLDEVNEAYRLISEHEHEALYDLEVLNFLRWKRSLFPPKTDVTDNRKEYYFTATDFKSITEAAPVILPNWVTGFENGNNDITGVLSTAQKSNQTAINRDLTEIAVENIRSIPAAKPFFMQIGSRVALNASFQEKYIANLLPSTIHAVYAYRIINGLRTLVPVPSSYYVKNESDNYGLFTATSITLVRPLKEYIEQNWEDKLYVTLTSSVGPNTVDIIQWIVETFTNLSVDPTSFASVKSALANYPSHFALLEKKDALSLIEDIAFQARCNVWLKSNAVQIIYLPVVPSTVATLTEDDIESGSLRMAYTDSESLVTKFTARWRPDYVQPRPNQIVLRANMAKYGELPQDYEFSIYNINDIVLHGATFWLIRHTNTWKRAIFNTFPTHLNLETNDWITLNLANSPFATDPVPALIEKAEYDSLSGTIKMECWLPVRAGEMVVYAYVFPANLSVDFIFPEAQAIATGNAGSPGNLVPTGINYDPGDPTLFRPHDFGELRPTDIKDHFPADPSDGFSEVDYTDLDLDAFEIDEPVLGPQLEVDASAHGDEDHKIVDNIRMLDKFGRSNLVVGFIAGPVPQDELENAVDDGIQSIPIPQTAGLGNDEENDDPILADNGDPPQGVTNPAVGVHAGLDLNVNIFRYWYLVGDHENPEDFQYVRRARVSDSDFQATLIPQQGSPNKPLITKPDVLLPKGKQVLIYEDHISGDWIIYLPGHVQPNTPADDLPDEDDTLQWWNDVVTGQ